MVDRFRGFFGHTVLTKPGAGLVNDPEPFNPKVVKYEIFGTGSRRDHQLPRPRRPAAEGAERRPLPWSLTLTTTAPAASPNIVAQSDGRQHHLPHHRRRRGQGREDHRRRERPDLLLGEVRMSNTHVGAHPMIPRFIRLFSVPILLGWIAIVVIVNVIAPQLEKVGEAHSVSLAPNDAPSMQAMQRIGKDFQEFDSNSSAMIVLEGDQPLGDAAHKYYDGLIDKLEADKKHVEHIQDFWGDPLTAAGAQSADGKAAYVQVYLAGNQGETPGQRVGRKRSATSSTSTHAATGRQGLRHRPRAADQRPAPRRRQEHQADHGDHHLRDLRDAAVRLPLHRHGAARPGDDVHRAGRRPGNRRGPRLLRPHRAVDVRGQPAHDAGDRGGNGLRDLPHRPISRGARDTARTAKPRSTRCITAPPTSSWARA